MFNNQCFKKQWYPIKWKFRFRALDEKLRSCCSVSPVSKIESGEPRKAHRHPGTVARGQHHQERPEARGGRAGLRVHSKWDTVFF